MKKKCKIGFFWLLVVSIVMVLVIKLWSMGAFLPRSADVSSNRVVWNGREYSPASGEYTEGRTIAKGKEADWVIDAVEEDPSHTFIVARSFLDNYLLVADDYTIPTEGRVTTISWKGKYITDEAFIEAVTNIEAEKITTFTYETEHIMTQHMGELYVAYEDCPVTTEFKGYMGKVNGEWVITTDISWDTEDGYPKLYTVGCYRIPDTYWDVLAKYFS